MKRFVLIMLAIVLAFSSNAQDDDFYKPQGERAPSTSKPSFTNKLFVGGNLGLSFGSITYVGINPLVGYKFTPRFHAGVSGTYQYREFRPFGRTEKVSFNNYGASVFGRVLVYENFFVYAEQEALHGKWEYNRDAYFISSSFVGGGYLQEFGNAFISLMVLFNLNDSELSPYTNPVIRMNFGLNL